MDDLDAKMKAKGMLSMEEMLAGNIMGDFSTHAGVTDFPSLLGWAEKKHEEFLRMRMKYEVGDKDKNDDLYEWVFAHASAFGTIVDHLRKVAPTVQTIELETAPDDLSPI